MARLSEVISDINKRTKEELISTGSIVLKCSRIPFSSPRMQYMTFGGLPRGRLIEFSGEEGGGKTTTAVDICGQAQKLFAAEYDAEVKQLTELQEKGKLNKGQQSHLTYLLDRGPLKVCWVDCENTFDSEWAELLGACPEDFVFMSPQAQSAEEIFQMATELIDTGEIGLMVIDSFGVMLSQQAYDKQVGDRTYGGIAMALTNFSKRAEMLCARTNTMLIGINQLRDDLTSMYGGTTTIGGRAWKHNCSVRMEFRKGSFLDEKGNEIKRSSDEPQGNHVMVNVVKTKVFKPTRKTGFYTLSYTNGIDVMADLVEVLIKFGYILQGGAWFTFMDPTTGEILTYMDETGATQPHKVQGKANISNYLITQPELLQTVTDELNKVLLV